MWKQRFDLLILEFTESLKTVVLLPNLIVPPISPVLCSGISIITGCSNDSSHSVLQAFCRFKTFRANSITATWKPRQIPKNGFLFILHHLQASTFPSTPRLPKPPGTITALKIKNPFR